MFKPQQRGHIQYKKEKKKERKDPTECAIEQGLLPTIQCRGQNTTFLDLLKFQQSILDITCVRIIQIRKSCKWT